ncbi:MAG: hypothetical protein R6V19_14000 [Armatimonadota bacterium]
MQRIVTGLALMALCLSITGAAEYQFEDLGMPLDPKPADITFTHECAGETLAWAIVEGPSKLGLVGVNVETGEDRWLDLSEFGHSHIRVHVAENGSFYLYSGRPGHFLQYDPETHELTDLGVPYSASIYWVGHTVAPDGKMYVGTHPGAHLVCVDPKTDEISDLGRIPEDDRQKHLLYPAASADNIIYCPTGLHHAGLWAYNATDGSRRQILPEALQTKKSRVKPWTGTDGEVYFRMNDRAYRCTPTGIVEVQETVPAPDERKKRIFDGTETVRLTADGTLLLRDVQTGDTREVATDFEGVGVRIYKVACEWHGKIYGGGFEPANLFSFDPNTGATEDLGRVTGGRIQIYDILPLPKGLFLSTYYGCHLDFYNPETDENEHIATLYHDYDQERGLQLALGPDGMIYLASRPIKGHLGGALTRINPADLSFTCWRNIIENHSVHSVVSVPETNEIFFTSSIYGGSSSIPVEERGFIGLWDVQKEQVAWKGMPIPEDPSYGHAVMGRNDLIYVQAHDDFVVFDPVKREVVDIQPLGVERVNTRGMVDRPAGPDGLIFFLADGAIWAIDPDDNSVRRIAEHPSVDAARGVFVTPDGVLYYANGSHLWRVDLYPGR